MQHLRSAVAWISLTALALSGPASATPPADAIFLQAESFACDQTSWKVQDQASPYAPDSGLQHLWGATGGQGVATCEVTLPTAGHYCVWVRHSYMDGAPGSYTRGAFLLTIKQGNQVLAEGRFDENQPEPPGYIHRYTWAKLEADLPSGQLTLELSKLPPVECSGWTRYVDCLVLTTDRAYTPTVTDFQPKIWLRVRLGPHQTTPVYIHCFADHFRDPWYMHFSLSKDGYEETVAPTRGPAAYLSAGEATPWCDITPAIHEDRGARLELRGAEKYSYTEWLPSFEATFEFATAPDEAAIVKRFEKHGPGAGLVVITPGVLTPDTAQQLKADYEYCAESVAIGQRVGEVPFGRRPTKFPFFLGMAMRPELFTPELRAAEYRIVAQLGFNGTNDLPDELLTGLGITHCWSGTESWHLNDGCYCQPRTDLIRQSIGHAAERWGSRPPPDYIMVMDEPSANPLSHLASCSACQEAFRTWLQEEVRVLPEDLGVASWDEVKPVTGAERHKLPVLYYYSQRFRMKAFADFLRLHTDEVERRWPGAPPVTVNFSDGALYVANMYMMADYFDIFRTRALTLAGSEDWSNIASTYQNCGYNIDLLRSATKYHGQPLFMYLITSYGRTPTDVKLKAYSSLGRGVRILHSYYYGPHYVNHEGNWYLKQEMYRPMMELCREIGGAEELLLQAKRLPSRVAFLYSTSSDIWTIEDNYLCGHERVHAWLALTHAQVPVDFLSEDDVAEGGLAPYRVLYVFGPNLLSAAAAPIAEWVKAGGTLFLAAGSAVADEFNRPARPLDEALGLRRGEFTELHKYLGAGRYLITLQPQGQVAFGNAKLDILGTRQTLPPPAADSSAASVLATFADGTPALVRCRAGQGTVYLCGFMPGLSYIRKALAAREAHIAQAANPEDEVAADAVTEPVAARPEKLSYNPWEYPEAERELLLLPVTAAQVTRPVEVDRPLVEACYLEAPTGAVVTLANYSLQPIAGLAVSVRTPARPHRVCSVRQGELAFSHTNGRVALTLPLTDTDTVLLYW